MVIAESPPEDAAIALGPVQDGALRHAVTEYVLAALRSGTLKPGDKVPETTLAKALGVSFSPIREALFRLTHQGVLAHRPRHGFVVSVLGEQELREVTTFRAWLEGFAAHVVVERRLGNPAYGAPLEMAAFEPLAAIVNEGEQAARAGELLETRACNARFHDAAVRLAGHSLIDRAWALLSPVTWLFLPGMRVDALTPERVESWSERHRRLLDALMCGTSQEADHEASTHAM